MVKIEKELLLEQFLEYLTYQKHYSTHTIDGYESDVAAYFMYVDQTHLSFPDITYEEIRHYLMYMKETKKRTASSISRHLSSLRSFYHFLCSKGLVESNMFLLVHSPKQGQSLPRYFEYNELEELFSIPDLSTPRGVRDRLILELLYGTGVRVQELVRIKVKDIEQSREQILIHGKGKKDRIVNYGEYTKEILELYLKEAYPRFNKFDREELFLNQQGRNLTTRGVQYLLKVLIEKTSLHKNISPHMLRHSFATHLLNEGCDILSVKELLGHESIASTQIYTHVTTEQLKDVYHHSFPRAVMKDKK